MGTRFGRYEVLDEIAAGDAARVMRARAATGHEVAIKVYIGTAPDDFARFRREQRLTEALGHAEGFVPLIEAGDSPQGPYIVMPFLSGGSLREPLMEGSLDPRTVLGLGVRLGSALGVAHSRGIVHRDLKPENILFDATKKTAYVADLGLAKHFRRDVLGASRSLSISSEGDVLGTVGYMAPEQITGDAVTPRTDVFSLGAILHECLTGRPVFTGADLFELGQKIVNGVFDKIASIREDVPVGLASAIEIALSKEPAKRFSDGKDLARALSRVRF